MKPTKQQWDAVKRDLSHSFGYAYFIIDGYCVCAEVRQYKMRLVIAVFVNGQMRGSDLWYGKESQIDDMPEKARRFYAVKTRARYTAKEIKSYERAFGKKTSKERGIYDRWVYNSSYFSTAGAFITHLKKHNDAIRIVDSETHDMVMATLPKEAE